MWQFRYDINIQWFLRVLVISLDNIIDKICIYKATTKWSY